MASSVASTSSASSLVLPPRVLPELRAVPPNLPFDVLAHIFDFLLLASSTPLTCLLISRDLTRALRPRAHQNVVLSSLRGLDAFAELLERDPAVARRVRAIWIAPLSVASDLVPALSPAAAGRSPAAIRAHTRVRSILRSCRKLRHLALDGGFVSQEAARAFGTACKPETLFAINPQSYVGGFSAPMFARCRRLHMCDGSLTHEEIDEIRAMPDLRDFMWTCPRDHTYVERDVDLFMRILAPSASDLYSSLQALSIESSGSTPPPERSRKAVKLRSLSMRSPDSRSSAVGTAFLRVTRPPPTPGSQAAPMYVDSSAAHARAVHPSGVLLRSQPLPDESLVEEWDALRDALRDPLCGSAWGWSRPATPDQGEADPSMAYRRCFAEWHQQLTDGKLEDDEEVKPQHADM